VDTTQRTTKNTTDYRLCQVKSTQRNRSKRCCGLGFNGNNHLQCYIDCKTSYECPNCGCRPERSTHMIYCRDLARSEVFSHSLDKLVSWLSIQRTDPELITLLSTYLRARGDQSMLSLCGLRSRYCQLADMVDALGFRNMLESRIP
jgi:hypothetical protein